MTDFETKAREVIEPWLFGMPDQDGNTLVKAVASLMDAEYARGVEKGAEISRYHRDKNGARALPAWVAACNDIETSCLATAGRIRRGEYENPIAVCMSVPKKEGGG